MAKPAVVVEGDANLQAVGCSRVDLFRVVWHGEVDREALRVLDCLRGYEDRWSVLIGNVAQFDVQNGGGGDDGVAVKGDGASYGVALLAGSCGQSTEGDQGNGEDEPYDSAPGDEASLPYRLRIRLFESPQDSRRYWTGRYFKAISSQVAAAGTRAPRRCTPDCSPGLLLRHTIVGGMASSTGCSARTVCPVLLRDVYVCSPSPSGGKATPLSSWGRFHSVRNTPGHSVSSQGGGILCRRL